MRLKLRRQMYDAPSAIPSSSAAKPMVELIMEHIDTVVSARCVLVSKRFEY